LNKGEECNSTTNKSLIYFIISVGKGKMGRSKRSGSSKKEAEIALRRERASESERESHDDRRD